MEQTQQKFAEGIYLSKTVKGYFSLSIKQPDGTYKKYVAFESKKKDKFDNLIYSVFDKQEKPKEDLPF
jgi:hypothetical protein